MQHLLARSTRLGRLARSTTSGGQFELFLVASVASLLLIRFFLAWMGFPQVGGGGLHIAHLLWGGLLMLLAILLLAALQMNAPGADIRGLILGHSSRVCAFNVLIVALPTLAATFWALRRLGLQLMISEPAA